MPNNPEDLAQRFNQAINARDLEGLMALVTEDHLFVDSGQNEVRGKERIREVWAGFFSAFPDYRQVLEQCIPRAGEVVFVGRSECSQAALRGPALWKAVIRTDRIAEWRVYEDTPETRRRLSLEP